MAVIDAKERNAVTDELALLLPELGGPRHRSPPTATDLSEPII